MTDPATVKRRYFIIVGSQLIGTAGAVLGLLLIGRSEAMAQKLLGIAIVLSALLVIAIVPRSLARRWRTPPDA